MIVDMTRRETRYLGVMSALKMERSAHVTLVRRVTGSRDVKPLVTKKVQLRVN